MSDKGTNIDAARRTQAERTAGTRTALIRAARELFGTRGYADVGTEAVVRAAGVSRGALYHQFADKTELFAAVFEELEREIAERLTAQLASAATGDPLEVMRLGGRAWLDICEEPDVRRIALLDAAAVLGSERRRAISLRYGLGLVEAVLEQMMAGGHIPRRPVAALAHLLIGALDEGALYIARAEERGEDRAAARADVEAAYLAMLGGLAG